MKSLYEKISRQLESKLKAQKIEWHNKEEMKKASVPINPGVLVPLVPTKELSGIYKKQTTTTNKWQTKMCLHIVARLSNE